MDSQLNVKIADLELGGEQTLLNASDNMGMLCTWVKICMHSDPSLSSLLNLACS